MKNIFLKNCCDGIYDSLDIRITQKCDNSCGFCIENKCNFNTDKETDVNILISKTIESRISSVLILGGEPFLNIKRLKLYVEGIRDYVKTIYITTSLPITISKNISDVKIIMSLIDGLNVSFQHYSWQKNNDIMNATSNHNRFYILGLLVDINADKVRAAINIVKGGIDTEGKLNLFINKAKSYGAKNIKINELCHSSENYVSYEKMMSIKMKPPFSHGCQTRMIKQGVNIDLKRSCFITEKTLNATLTDLLKIVIMKLFKIKSKNKFAVLYEDGSIYNDWQTGGQS